MGFVESGPASGLHAAVGLVESGVAAGGVQRFR
jgi:hypothetical protein